MATRYGGRNNPNHGSQPAKVIQKHALEMQLDNLGKCFYEYKNKNETRSDIHSLN